MRLKLFSFLLLLSPAVAIYKGLDISDLRTSESVTFFVNENWKVLFDCFSNSRLSVSVAGSVGFHELLWNYQWLPAPRYKSPVALILAHSTEDVANSVKCVRSAPPELLLKVTPRSGGHSYENLSLGSNRYNHIIIDLHEMAEAWVDPKNESLVHVQPGIRLSSLYNKVYNKMEKKFIPQGVCGEVGFGGYIHGGGLGYFTRLFGHTSDFLKEAEVVMADGSIKILKDGAARDSHEDDLLLWALRGGGGGNFGILTRAVMESFDASMPWTTVRFSWRAKDMFKVMYHIQGLILNEKIPRRWGGVVLGTSFGVSFYLIAPGGSMDRKELAEIESPSLPGVKPLSVKWRQTDFPRALSSALGIFQFPNPFEERSPYYQPRDIPPFRAVSFLHGALSLSQWKVLQDLHFDFSKSSSDVYMFELIDRNGSAKGASSAFDEMLFSAAYYTSYLTKNAPSKSCTFRDHVIRTLSSSGIGLRHYTNYADVGWPDWLRTYYGDENAKRLLEAKRKYDPTDLFHHAQSIPLSLNEDDEEDFMGEGGCASSKISL